MNHIYDRTHPSPNSRTFGCEGKERFDRREDAERVARRKRRNQGGTTAAYRCGCCHSWHVGGDHGFHRKRTAVQQQRSRERWGDA